MVTFYPAYGVSPAPPPPPPATTTPPRGHCERHTRVLHRRSGAAGAAGILQRRPALSCTAMLLDLLVVWVANGLSTEVDVMMGEGTNFALGRTPLAKGLSPKTACRHRWEAAQYAGGGGGRGEVAERWWLSRQPVRSRARQHALGVPPRLRTCW